MSTQQHIIQIEVYYYIIIATVLLYPWIFIIECSDTFFVGNKDSPGHQLREVFCYIVCICFYRVICGVVINRNYFVVRIILLGYSLEKFKEKLTRIEVSSGSNNTERQFISIITYIVLCIIICILSFHILTIKPIKIHCFGKLSLIRGGDKTTVEELNSICNIFQKFECLDLLLLLDLFIHKRI